MFDQGPLEIWPERPYPVMAVAAVEIYCLGLTLLEEGKHSNNLASLLVGYVGEGLGEASAGVGDPFGWNGFLL